jgi:hypothetical protein
MIDACMKSVKQEKSGALGKFRLLPPELVTNLEDWFRVELTYKLIEFTW